MKKFTMLTLVAGALAVGMWGVVSAQDSDPGGASDQHDARSCKLKTLRGIVPIRREWIQHRWRSRPTESHPRSDRVQWRWLADSARSHPQREWHGQPPTGRRR